MGLPIVQQTGWTPWPQVGQGRGSVCGWRVAGGGSHRAVWVTGHPGVPALPCPASLVGCHKPTGAVRSGVGQRSILRVTASTAPRPIPAIRSGGLPHLHRRLQQPGASGGAAGPWGGRQHAPRGGPAGGADRVSWGPAGQAKSWVLGAVDAALWWACRSSRPSELRAGRGLLVEGLGLLAA